jgi:PPOX class probable F420-dependent enzyme
MADGFVLAPERYINLESFKKDGMGVKTPVWAAPLDGKLVIVTDGTSFKVKRLRNNPKCRAAACDVRGKVKGPFYDFTCRVTTEPGDVQRMYRALAAKYGWQVKVLNFFAVIGRRIGRRAYLELTPVASA